MTDDTDYLAQGRSLLRGLFRKREYINKGSF